MATRSSYRQVFDVGVSLVVEHLKLYPVCISVCIGHYLPVDLVSTVVYQRDQVRRRYRTVVRA